MNETNDYIAKSTLDILETAVQNIQNKDKIQIKIDSKKKEKFNKIFKENEEKIRMKYMKPEVENLDRHKIAGLLIYAIISSDIIVPARKCGDKEIFFGKYLIAVNIGLSYLLDRLNELLIAGNHITKEIEEIWMPPFVFSCPNNPYYEVFARNLLFSEENKDWNINPLDLSEKLFLLEFVTLEKTGINPEILKEKQVHTLEN